MPSHHTATGAISLEHKERYHIITDEKFGTFWLRYRTPSGSGKYIGFGLRIETEAERTIIIIEDISDIIIGCVELSFCRSCCGLVSM